MLLRLLNSFVGVLKLRFLLDLCCDFLSCLKDGLVQKGLSMLKSFLLLLSPRENGTFLHQVGQRLEYSCSFRQERPEEVEQTQELAYILFTSGLRIVSDAAVCLEDGLMPLALTTWPRNSNSEEKNSDLAALMGLAQALEYLAQVSAVLLLILGTNQNVIQINENKI